MSDFLAKLSSYNIFNYLFPGALFVTLWGEMNLVHLPKVDLITRLLIYYVTGLTISRFGSILLEPTLKTWRFVRHSAYDRYVIAARKDEKISTLVEAANTYRTMATGFLCTIAGPPAAALAARAGLPDENREVTAMGLLLILFAWSWRKQCDYVRARVEVP